MCVAALHYVHMVTLLGNPNIPPRNLFTPDFGQVPHVVIGRDMLTASLHEGLSAGPGDKRFTTLLLGPRGSGKTVMLNIMRGIARQSGWIVLPLDSATEGIGNRVNEYLVWAQDTHESIPDVTVGSREQRTAAKLKLPMLLEWQHEVVQRVEPRWNLRRQLTTLAIHAADHESGVLLIIDELHSGQRAELRRLAADLQHITKNEGLPLAFLGAGLSEMKHTLLEDKRMTFFQRCNREDMRPLTPADAAGFLLRTVRDAGGTFEGHALGTLADAAGSLPFKMQLIGDYAWRIADAPLSPISDQAASLALREANRDMHDQVALPTWHSLNDSEKEYLRALAAEGGAATPRQIAQYSLLPPTTLSRAEQHLVNAGCILVRSPGAVEIGDVITSRDMTLIAEHEARYADTSAAGSAQAAARDGHRARCNVLMPRAQARCVLSAGHAGGHRSR